MAGRHDGLAHAIGRLILDLDLHGTRRCLQLGGHGEDARGALLVEGGGDLPACRLRRPTPEPQPRPQSRTEPRNAASIPPNRVPLGQNRPSAPLAYCASGIFATSSVQFFPRQTQHYSGRRATRQPRAELMFRRVKRPRSAGLLAAHQLDEALEQVVAVLRARARPPGGTAPRTPACPSPAGRSWCRRTATRASPRRPPAASRGPR